jgi:hypothetical protein
MRLLDRQARLLEYLTSGRAIFGGDGEVPIDHPLHGIDFRLLRLEAQFSHRKRMEKIKSVFPISFRLLEHDWDTMVGEFVRTCPPAGVARLENAQQFYDFLCGRWRETPPVPPHLSDVAACELAIARVRSGIAAAHAEPVGGKPQPLGGIRRHPQVVLLRCGCDIRPVFEDASRETAPTRRDTPLAIAIPPDAEHPRILEVSPLVFQALEMLDDWTDRSELGVASQVDELIDELARHGLVEVHA